MNKSYIRLENSKPYNPVIPRVKKRKGLKYFLGSVMALLFAGWFVLRYVFMMNFYNKKVKKVK